MSSWASLLQRRCPAGIFWPLVGIWLLWALLFWPTLLGMVAIWERSETFAHGFLVFPVSYFLIWRTRLKPVAGRSRRWLLGPLLGALAALMWLAGQLIHVQVAQQLGALLALWALCGAFLGWGLLRQLGFPLGFMLFAVPFGEFLIPQLQQLTAAISVALLRLSQIPVYVEGLYLYTAHGTFEVAVACSGIRYLIASLALGTLYAYLSYRSLWRRLAFVALALLVPLLANGLRAYGIILIAYLSEMRYATSVDHLIYGWLFFGLVMWLLFWIGNFWSQPPSADKGPADDATAAIARRRALWSTLLVVGLLGGARWWHQYPPAEPAWTLTDGAMPALGQWQPAPAPPEGLGRFQGADIEIAQAYTDGSRRVLLYLAVYHREQQNRELVNSVNRAFDEHWSPVGRVSLPLMLGGRDRLWPVLTLRNGQHRRLAVGGYWVDGHLGSGQLETKLRQLWAGLRGHQGGAYIGLYVPYEYDQQQAVSTLHAFVEEGWPVLHTLLRSPPPARTAARSQYAGF